MVTTASGVAIPGSDPTITPATPIEALWNDLGRSLTGKITVEVASITARAALVVALAAEGYVIDAAHPLRTQRADAATGCGLEVTTNGTTWRTIYAAGSVPVTATTPGNWGPFTTRIALVTAPNIIGDGVMKWRITASLGGIQGTVLSDLFQLILVDATTGTDLKTSQAPLVSDTAGYHAAGQTIMAFHVPAAGLHGYRLDGVRAYGSGSGTALGSIDIEVAQIS